MSAVMLQLPQRHLLHFLRGFQSSQDFESALRVPGADARQPPLGRQGELQLLRKSLLPLLRPGLPDLPGLQGKKPRAA